MKGPLGPTLMAASLAAALLAPVASAARLTAQPSAVKVSASEGAKVRLSLDARDAEGGPRSGLLFMAESNFGSVGSVKETAPGRYEARLSLPPTDMPRSALVLFSAQDSESIELHHALIPVTVSTHLRARTEPRSQITIEAGGRSYGPAQTGRAGWFTLAFDQAPGTESAEVQIVDGAGNVKRSTLPVPVRPHDALTVTLDRYRVASDGRGRVRVHALVFDKRGRPVPGARIEATADRGSLSEFIDHGDGIHGTEWSAPSDGQEGVATLRLRVRHGGRVHEEIERVSIVRGPARRLALLAEPSELTVGERPTIELKARASDAAGNGLAGQAIRLSSDRGELEELRDLGDGNYASRLEVPEEVGSGSIEVKALLVDGAPGKPPSRIVVTANPEVVPTSWRAFSLVTATVTDDAGKPVPGEVVLFHVARGEGTVTPAAVTNAEGRAFADFSADPTEEIVAIEATATSVLALRGETRIEKRASGEFAIINRPARAAHGGETQAVYDFSDEHRVLQASALITIKPGVPASLSVSADPSLLIADGRSTSRVTALLRDARGNEIPGAELRFSVDVGTISEGSNVSDGSYQALFTSPEGRGDGRALVTATEVGSGLSATTVIELEVGPPASLLLVSDRDELPADGVSSARLTASVQDASGQPVPEAKVRFRNDGVDVDFSPSATTDARGLAEIDLTAGRDSGPVRISAEVDEGLSASVDLTLLPTEPVELTLSAAPLSILANGAERSELSAELLDPFGQAVVGHIVEFRIKRGPGQLTQRTARTDALGLARVWLSSTDAGSAAVTARSLELPSLRDEREVELRLSGLVASFEVKEPACSGGVLLTSTGDETLTHEWDWTGDGVPDATGLSALAPLPAGSATVRLRVSDAEDREAASEQVVEVLPSPVAVASASASHVAPGQSVELDGSASSAGAGGPLRYDWDLNGDGTPDQSGARITWPSPDEGSQVAQLIVSEPSGCESRASVEVVFGDIPDLTVTASAPGVSLPMPAGTAFELEINWANQGRATAPATIVGLELSPELTLNGAPPAGATDLGGGRLRFALGDIAPGDSGPIRVPLRATSEPATPSSLARATASIRHAVPGGESAPIEAALSLPIVPDVDLTLSCSSITTAKPGEEFDLDLSLSNQGVSMALGVGLDVDWRSDQVELLASVPPGLASATGLRIDWADLAGSGASEAVSLRFRVLPVLPGVDNSVRIGANASHSVNEVAPGDESCPSVIDVPAAPDAWVAIRATPDRSPAGPGDTIVYELRYGNRGSTAATAVVVEGRFETGVFQSSLVENPDSGVFSATSGTIRFLPGPLPADPLASHALRYRARLGSSLPSDATEVRTEVEVQHAQPDGRPSDDLDFVTVPIESAPDVLLSVQAPASVGAGSTVTYLVTVSSQGDVPAEGVLVDVAFSGADASVVAGTLPPNATLMPGGAVRFDLGNMATPSSAPLRLDVRTAPLQAMVDPTLRSDWTAGYGAPGSRRQTSLQRDVAVHANALLDLDLQLSAATAAAGEQVEVSVELSASGQAPFPAGTIDLGCADALFVGTAPTGQAFPTLNPGDSLLLGPWTMTVQPILPATSTNAVVSAVVSGTGIVDSETLTLTASPSLELRISELPAEADAGQWIDLTLAHRNSGTTAATGVVLSPAEVGGPGGLLVEFDPPSRSVGTVPADGLERTVNFRARLADTLPGCRTAVDLVPQASLSEAPGSAIGSSASMDALGEPDLRVELTAVPSREPPGPNDFITYELLVANVGTAPALVPSLGFERDLMLLPDVLPPLPGGGSVSGNKVLVSLPDLAPGDITQRSVRLRVATTLPAPSNSARCTLTATESSCESRVGDNIVGLTIIVGAVADLVVAMDVRTDPSELIAGGSMGATLFLSNTGTTDAENVVLTLGYPGDFPAGLVAALSENPPANASGAGQVTWSGLTVPSGQPPQRFDVSFSVSDELPEVGNLFSLFAGATTTSPENRLDNNQADATRTARAWADLCLDLEAVPVPQPATAAGRIDYRVSLRNDGTTTARGTIVSLDYDSSLLSPQGGGPDPFEWTVGDLAPSASIDLAQTFRIPNSIPGGTATAAAVASAAAAEHDAWSLAACDASDDSETVITDEADLALSKSVSWTDAELLRGSVLDYTITVTNVGNSDADLGGPSVGQVEDLVPAGLLVLASGGGTWDGTTLRWDLPASLNRGDSWSAIYQLEVDGALPPGVHRLTNTAQVLPAGTDASATNDVDSATVEMRFDVDLSTSVTCTAVPAPAVPGSLLEYEAVVENLGAYEATNVSLDLDGGPELIFQAPLSGSGSVIVPGPSSLPAGGRWVYRFSARSLEAFPDPSTVVTLKATASSPEADADPSNDRGDSACTVLASVDMRVGLAISEADATPPAGAAEDLDIDLVLENVGSRIESGVELVVEFDPELAAFVSGPAFVEEAPGRLRHVRGVDFDPRDPPEALSLRLRTVDVLNTAFEVLEVCADVSSPGPDIFPADNNACRQLQLFAAPDLRVTRSASTPSSPARPGEAITHDVLVENLGTTAATGVMLQHVRDEERTTGLLPGSASHPASESGTLIQLSLGTVGVGPGAAVAVGYQLGIAGVLTTIDDSASSDACALASEADANPADDCATLAVAIEALPDANVSLRVEPSTGLMAGQGMTAFIDYGNIGSSPLQNPVLRLELDPSVELVDGMGASGPGPLVLSGLADLAAGESRQEVVLLRLTDTLPDISNSLPVTASLQHDATARDADAANDSATVTLDATGQVDLIATITLVSPADPQAGDLLVYEVGWSNAGSTTATGVTLDLGADPLVSLPDGSTPPDPDVRALPDLALGASGSQQFSYRLPSVLPQDLNTITFRATLAASEPEAVPADNIAWLGIQLAAHPDVRVSSLAVLAAPDPPAAGSTFTVTAEHDNHGTTTARGTQLVLSFDDDIAALIDAGGGSYDGARQVVFNLGDVPMTTGGPSSSTIELRAHDVQADLEQGLTLSAEISATNEPNDPSFTGDNIALQFPTVFAEPDLVVEVQLESSNPSPAEAGGTVTLLTTVRNIGTTGADEVLLDLSWDDVLIDFVIDGDGAAPSGSPSLQWNLGTVLAGAPAIERRVVLQVEGVLPAPSNELRVDALVSSVDSDSDPASNQAFATVELLGRVDLVLSAVAEPPGTIGDGAFIFYTYSLTNVGSTAAQDPCVRSAYDPQIYAWAFGGSDEGTVVETCFLGPIAPGDPPRSPPTVMFQAMEPGTGEVRHEIKRTHEAAETGKTPADDAVPADNVTDTTVIACFLSTTISSPSSPNVCMDSSITLVANPSIETGVTYQWSSAGGGSFDDPTAKSVTFTPPSSAGVYPVHVRVTHSSGCVDDTNTPGDDRRFSVRVVTDCNSCGCHPANLKLNYVDGTLERVDQPGSTRVEQGETVAFRLRVTDSGTGKSATIRRGTTLTFADGAGSSYTANLAYPIFFECRQTVTLTFNAAQVPAGMNRGDYEPIFIVDALDACGNGSPRNSNVTDDVLVRPPSGNSLDPGVSFSDWGPERIRR